MFLSKFVIGKHGFSRTFHLAKGLVSEGHQVTLLCADPEVKGRNEIIEGVKLVTFTDISPYSVKKGGISIIDTVSRLVYLIGKQFDLVMVDSGFRPVTGIPGHFYAWLKNIPYICEWWDWIGKGGLYERKSLAYKCSLGVMDHYFEVLDKKHSDGISCLSEALRDRAIGLGLSSERSMVLYGGADLEISSGKTKREARDSLGIDQGAFLVGFAGMDEQEVMDVIPFMESIQGLKEDIPHFSWFSTGGRLRYDFRERFNVSDEYLEFGWVSYEQYRDCLAAADVLLLIQENNLINVARWPNKVGDYFAVGRPVLATAVGEIVHFAEKYEKHGIHFVGWERAQIHQALVALSSNPELLNEMGRLNLKIARSDCSWEQKARDLSQFLVKIMTLGKR